MIQFTVPNREYLYILYKQILLKELLTSRYKVKYLPFSEICDVSEQFEIEIYKLFIAIVVWNQSTNIINISVTLYRER